MHNNITLVQFHEELHLKDGGRLVHSSLGQLHANPLYNAIYDPLRYKRDPLQCSTLQTFMSSDKTQYQNNWATIYPSQYLRAPPKTLDLTKEGLDLNIYKVTNLIEDLAKLNSNTKLLVANNVEPKRHDQGFSHSRLNLHKQGFCDCIQRAFCAQSLET